MDPLWQFKFGSGSLQCGSDAGVMHVACKFISLDADRATLTVHPDVNPAYGSSVEIWYGGVRQFIGRVQTPRLIRNGQNRVREIPLIGPWYWLTRVGFRQSWVMLLDAVEGGSPTIGASLTSRVILNQTSTGAQMSVEAQLAEIVNCANTRGAPIQFGTAAVGLTLPFDEQRDLMCAQAILRVLRFSPAVTSRIDYAASTPTIYFGGGEAFTSPTTLEDSDVTLRHDLVLPGITIEVERMNNLNGMQYRSLQVLTAGDASNLEAQNCTLQAAGQQSKQTVVKVNVQVEAIPTPLTDAQYWINHHTRLKNISAADVTVNFASRYWMDAVSGLSDGLVSDDDAALAPNRSLTPLAKLDSVNVFGRSEIWRASMDIVKRDGDGNIVDVETGVILEWPVVTTNAITGIYRAVTDSSYESAEPVPANLATELLASWSILFSQGVDAWPMSDGIPAVGALYRGGWHNTARRQRKPWVSRS